MSSIFGNIFGKSDYKKKIKQSGFEKLIEFHDIHNDDRMKGGKYRFSDRHIIRQNYIQNNLGNISNFR